ncbi:immobilization antigen isoform, putative [Ichthyophthirius multifiliis]|uniref:Immobilization antigen isoform, putative n=1 Tax=Ichthyophthirius multifiliis TaxID=5932 RepID=G0QPL3_ICHMU|nr:immobilization antigen isoform, putative [Ichthyophthirius multifiliis]EGR32845.1 immobilization antigen isoform, putative [Ichthyophthirius multifiliis]|eukprot:XP_004036831.1 immobilization antigen isoform, putative [Ichthyophthirius multifiliis]
MKNNILVILIISLFINQIKSANCPVGTETNTAGQVDDLGNPANCVNCQKNFYYNNAAAFVPGASTCTPCPQKKDAGAQPNPPATANLVTQCNVKCPAGTAIAGGATDYAAIITECVNCRINFYNENAPNFNAGASTCTACPVNRVGGALNAGNAATIVAQCNVACPTGTALDDGVTTDYVRSFTECVKCRVNFYYNGNNGNTPFNPGKSQCTPCPAIKPANVAQATLGNDATITAQCNVACPDGTISAAGVNNWVAQNTECTNCAPNFYNNNVPNFNPGNSTCLPCPANKDYGAEATAGGAATLAKQCNIACPDGTAIASGATNYVALQTECLNCAANFYFDGNNFQAGSSRCKACPANKVQGAVATAGGTATLIAQCALECPAGTVLTDGTTSTYKQAASECVKCAANFYTTKQTDWVAGIDTCTSCNKKLTSGAEANLPESAKKSIQCDFANFLSISLLLISYYLL